VLVENIYPVAETAFVTFWLPGFRMTCQGFSSKTAKQSRKSKEILNELRLRLSPSLLSVQNTGIRLAKRNTNYLKKERRTDTFSPEPK